MASTFAKYALRHLVAGSIVVGIACTLLVALYFALLLMAIILNQGIGSPAALPLWFLIVAVVAGSICLVLFLPSTAISDVVGRKREWSLQKKFALALACYAAVIFIIAASWPLIDSSTGLADSLVAGGVIMVILLVPMGGYWLLVQFSGWVFKMAANAYRRISENPTSPAKSKPSARPLYLNPVRKKPPLH